MSRESGRAGFGTKWPSEKPVGVILALVMAVVSTGAILFYQYEREWPFVQRLYLPTYLATGLAGTSGAWPTRRQAIVALPRQPEGAAMSRWLTWTPGSQKFSISPDPEPTKPSKPGFVGFDGSPLGETQNFRAAPDPANRCFHCGGKGECDCIACGQYRAHVVWAPGRCLPCQARQERERVQ